MFLRLFAVLVAIWLTTGDAFDISERIYKGVKSERNQFPYYVFVQRHMSQSLGKTCGGSLISSVWILTAAHCAIGGKFISVHLGMHETRNATEEGRVISVIRKDHVYVHPSYKGIMNDIALIKLSQPIKFTSFIRPIKLSRSIHVEEDVDVIALGNGYVNDGDKMADYLEWIHLKTISFEHCKNILPITKSIICAGNGKGSVTFGDSGGPLVAKSGEINETLIGISSFVHSQTSLGEDGGIVLPQAFTHIARFIQWIRFITKINFEYFPIEYFKI